jgi:excisionase family DNA binding protein
MSQNKDYRLKFHQVEEAPFSASATRPAAPGGVRQRQSATTQGSTFGAARRAAPAESEPPRFFTPAEVARMFRVSKMTVYRSIQNGDLPAIHIRGRWAVPARAIDAMEDSALAALDIRAARRSGLDWPLLADVERLGA